MTIEWSPTRPGELCFLHPRGSELRYGDRLRVRENQMACFHCGGERFWLTGPAEELVGFDDRPAEEIRLAAQLGEQTGLPPMIDTKIIFYSLAPSSAISCAGGEPLRIDGRVAVWPSFTYTLTLTAPELLEPGTAPDPEKFCEIAGEALRKAFANRLETLAKEISSTRALEEAIRRQAADLTAGLREVTVAEWGLTLSELKLESLRTHRCFCPKCGSPVELGAETCPNGHAQHWCSVCGEQILDGRCSEGHFFIFCRYCGKNVLAKNGCCPVHGGKGLPYQP